MCWTHVRGGRTTRELLAIACQIRGSSGHYTPSRPHAPAEYVYRAHAHGLPSHPRLASAWATAGPCSRRATPSPLAAARPLSASWAASCGSEVHEGANAGVWPRSALLVSQRLSRIQVQKRRHMGRKSARGVKRAAFTFPNRALRAALQKALCSSGTTAANSAALLLRCAAASRVGLCVSIASNSRRNACAIAVNALTLWAATLSVLNVPRMVCVRK